MFLSRKLLIKSPTVLKSYPLLLPGRFKKCPYHIFSRNSSDRSNTLGLIKTNEMINQQYQDDCNRRGKCIGGKCHCYRKWRGINCAIPRKMCPKKCLNGGTCTDKGRYDSHKKLKSEFGRHFHLSTRLWLNERVKFKVNTVREMTLDLIRPNRMVILNLGQNGRFKSIKMKWREAWKNDHFQSLSCFDLPFWPLTYF